jgi:hypothetical protein
MVSETGGFRAESLFPDGGALADGRTHALSPCAPLSSGDPRGLTQGTGVGSRAETHHALAPVFRLRSNRGVYNKRNPRLYPQRLAAVLPRDDDRVRGGQLAEPPDEGKGRALNSGSHRRTRGCHAPNLSLVRDSRRGVREVATTDVQIRT